MIGSDKSYSLELVLRRHGLESGDMVSKALKGVVLEEMSVARKG